MRGANSTAQKARCGAAEGEGGRAVRRSHGGCHVVVDDLRLLVISASRHVHVQLDIGVRDLILLHVTVRIQHVHLTTTTTAE